MREFGNRSKSLAARKRRFVLDQGIRERPPRRWTYPSLAHSLRPNSTLHAYATLSVQMVNADGPASRTELISREQLTQRAGLANAQLFRNERVRWARRKILHA
jgi:hypothetical protein